jgi:hypothetical protein
LVYTFAKPFYRDTLNFPRNSVFDSPPIIIDSGDNADGKEEK